MKINGNQLLLSETISVEYAWSITLMDQPITLEHICKKTLTTMITNVPSLLQLESTSVLL